MPASEKTAEFLAEFHACERRLRAYVRCQVQRIQDAEEVYQEISTVLWTHFDKFRQAATFFPGLARLPGGRYWPITAIGAAWQS